MAGHGKLFTTRSDGWTWHFTDEKVWHALAPSPELPTPDSYIVKESVVRLVFRRNGFFIKVERPASKMGLALLKAMLAPKAKAEFDAARALAVKGVPVVEALGYGSSGASQALVTRAVDGAVPSSEFYNANFAEDAADPSGYLSKWAAFVRRVVDSGLFHPDFHNGNILYKPGSGEFLLVDVFGVKSPERVSEGQRDAMRRIVFEMRRNLPAASFAKLAGDCGVTGEPMEYLEKGLDAEAMRLKAEWPKRKGQLLAAYPKFVERRRLPHDHNGALMVLLDSARRPLVPQGLVEIKDIFDIVNDQAAFLKSFYLELAGIPHRRAVAWEPDSGNVYFERVSLGAKPSAKELDELAFQARHFGVDVKAASLACDAKGRLIVANCELQLP